MQIPNLIELFSPFDIKMPKRLKSDASVPRDSREVLDIVVLRRVDTV
jgi:hypothetical protein